VKGLKRPLSKLEVEMKELFICRQLRHRRRERKRIALVH